MQRTPEQIAADNRLDDAISECARAYGIVEDGEIFTSWVIAAHTQGQDDEHSRYVTLHPGGVQPTHVAVGLLRMAEDQILSPEDDDE